MSNTTADIIKQIAQKVQSGWKLTNKYCQLDQCNTPLVQDNHDKKIWCLKCNIYYKYDTDDNTVQNNNADVKSIQNESNTVHNNNIKSNEIDIPVNTTETLYERLSKQLNQRTVPTELDSDSSYDHISPLQAQRNTSTLLGLSENPMYEQLKHDMLKQYNTSDTVAPDTTNDNNTVNTIPTVNESRMNQVSSLLGQRMLTGWTLLGDTCHTCNCPLVRKDTDLYCVACDKPIENNNNDSEAIEPTTVVTDTTQTTAQQQPQVFNMSTAMNKAMSSLSSSARSSANVTPEQSPTVLDRRLSRVPERVSAVDNSIIEDLSDDAIHDDDMYAIDGIQQQRLQRSNEISAKLGEKMLAGWTLLGIHCPSDECNCPLVKSKQGIMLCVSCNSQVITPDQYDPTIHTVTNTTGTTQPNNDISNTTVPIPDNTSTIATTTLNTINNATKRSVSANTLLSRAPLETGSLKNRLRPSALPPVAMKRSIDSTSTPLNTPNVMNKLGQLPQTLSASRSNSLVADSIFSNNMLSSTPIPMSQRMDSSNMPTAPPATPLDPLQRQQSLTKLPFATSTNDIINAPLTANSSPSVVAQCLTQQQSTTTQTNVGTSTEINTTTQHHHVTLDQYESVMRTTMDSLIHKIHATSIELSQCTTLEQTCMLSDTINKLAQAIKSMQALQQ